MGEPGKNHSDSVIGGERQLRLGYVGFKLIHDGGEDRIRETVQRPPLGVSKRGFHGPDMLGGERPKSRDRELGRGGMRLVVGAGGFPGALALGGGFGSRVRGDVREDGSDGEEEEGGGGGGGEKGGRGGGVGGGGGEVREEGGGGVEMVVEVEQVGQHEHQGLIHFLVPSE